MPKCDRMRARQGTGEPLQQSAEEWTEQLRAHASTLEMELFGITAFRPEWAFEGVEIEMAGLPVPDSAGEPSEVPALGAHDPDLIAELRRRAEAAPD